MTIDIETTEEVCRAIQEMFDKVLLPYWKEQEKGLIIIKR